jgi:hypothetical protein
MMLPIGCGTLIVRAWEMRWAGQPVLNYAAMRGAHGRTLIGGCSGLDGEGSGIPSTITGQSICLAEIYRSIRWFGDLQRPSRQGENPYSGHYFSRGNDSIIV